MNKILAEISFWVSLGSACVAGLFTYVGGLDQSIVEPETVAVLGGVNVVLAAASAVLIARIKGSL